MVPEGWRKTELQAVGQVILGQSPPSAQVTEVELGLPFLQGNAEFGARYPSAESWVENPPRTAPPNSALVSVRAPVGEVNRADVEYAIGRGLAAIVADEENVLPDYLFWVLVNSHAHYVSRRQGSTFLAINKSDLEELPVPLPPLPEQRKVAAILSSVDDAIATTRKVIEQTKRVKKGLLQLLMTRGIAHTRFNKTEIGEIPQTWDVKEVQALADVGYGLTVNQQRRESADRAPLLTVAAHDADDGWQTDRIAEIGLLEGDREKYAAISGDVLLVEGNGNPDLLGRPLIWDGRIPHALHQNHLIRVRPLQLESEWVTLALMSPPARQQVRGNAKSTSGLYTINSTVVKELRLPVAPPAERRAIMSVLESHDLAINRAGSTLTTLQTLKRGLLQDLLTGRVRVQPD